MNAPTAAPAAGPGTRWDRAASPDSGTPTGLRSAWCARRCSRAITSGCSSIGLSAPRPRGGSTSTGIRRNTVPGPRLRARLDRPPRRHLRPRRHPSEGLPADPLAGPVGGAGGVTVPAPAGGAPPGTRSHRPLPREALIGGGLYMGADSEFRRAADGGSGLLSVWFAFLATCRMPGMNSYRKTPARVPYPGPRIDDRRRRRKSAGWEQFSGEQADSIGR